MTQHKWSSPLVPGMIVGVNGHREAGRGLVELFAYHVREEAGHGSPIVQGHWELERNVQLQNEKVVLAYWAGLGSRDVALGPQKRSALRVLARRGDCWYLIQWTGYPACPPYATWVRWPVGQHGRPGEVPSRVNLY
ncbi:hypothetical protein F5Y16DRAFT_376773 [Xylariaceae sp. FL0255]|nr:hypothetical protein F5Y16DRAFT_376773 [Xylariaceae sp. FL0255]